MPQGSHTGLVINTVSEPLPGVRTHTFQSSKIIPGLLVVTNQLRRWVSLEQQPDTLCLFTGIQTPRVRSKATLEVWPGHVKPVEVMGGGDKTGVKGIRGRTVKHRQKTGHV
ncbi:hypothetical protein E2C01_093430 [Portunus trituberculatus]|uniref:Uncharacterized protein n=1 Tax=Portunus trituberculatus TaxID=210409 RepID=A0A5B7JTI1_PORTR|nr:hypothetical protein [Portunus trituberculatus]